MEGVARSVDDRLEELVPRPRRGRQARDAMEEPKLLELLGAGLRSSLPRRHGLQDTGTLP